MIKDIIQFILGDIVEFTAAIHDNQFASGCTFK